MVREEHGNDIYMIIIRKLYDMEAMEKGAQGPSRDTPGCMREKERMVYTRHIRTYNGCVGSCMMCI